MLELGELRGAHVLELLELRDRRAEPRDAEKDVERGEEPRVLGVQRDVAEPDGRRADHAMVHRVAEAERLAGVVEEEREYLGGDQLQHREDDDVERVVLHPIRDRAHRHRVVGVAVAAQVDHIPALGVHAAAGQPVDIEGFLARVVIIEVAWSGRIVFGKESGDAGEVVRSLTQAHLTPAAVWPAC